MTKNRVALHEYASDKRDALETSINFLSGTSMGNVEEYLKRIEIYEDAFYKYTKITHSQEVLKEWQDNHQ